MVLKDVRQGCFSFRRVEGCQVDAGVGKGLVGWSKDRERTGALQGLQQAGLDHGADQRIVDAGALGGSWDVVGRVGGHEHLVDDVDEAV